MLTALYWWIAFCLLFFLPGVSIIMAVLYGGYAIVRLLSSPLTVPESRAVAEQAAVPTKEFESAESTPDFDPVAARKTSAAFAADIRALEIERERHGG